MQPVVPSRDRRLWPAKYRRYPSSHDPKAAVDLLIPTVVRAGAVQAIRNVLELQGLHCRRPLRWVLHKQLVHELLEGARLGDLEKTRESLITCAEKTVHRIPNPIRARAFAFSSGDLRIGASPRMLARRRMAKRQFEQGTVLPHILAIASFTHQGNECVRHCLLNSPQDSRHVLLLRLCEWMRTSRNFHSNGQNKYAKSEDEDTQQIMPPQTNVSVSWLIALSL